VTDTLTPIWNMPRPGMLPNGVSVSHEPEIPAGVKVFNNSTVESKLLATKLGGLTVIRPEEPGDERLRMLEGLFSSGLGEYAAVKQLTKYEAPHRQVTQKQLVDQVERLRSSLFLTAEGTAAIAGLGPRRYYELVEGRSFPEGRLHEISGRIAVVSALAARDWQTAATLLRTRLAEIVGLLDGGRYRELQDLFRRAQDERLMLIKAGSSFDLPELAARNAEALTGALEAPAIDIVAKVLRWIGREDKVQQRGKAMVELFAVFTALQDDGQVGERWDFLYGLDAERRAAFNTRAETFIRSDAFTQDHWDAFVDSESRRAWASTDTVRLEPLESSINTYDEEDGGPVPWLPTISEISAGFRPYDRERQ
jgi:hypothetical protein